MSNPQANNPRALLFFSLVWQIPGDWTQAAKCPVVGMKKEGKCPVLNQNYSSFHWLQSKSNSATLSILMNNFLFQFMAALVI